MLFIPFHQPQPWRKTCLNLPVDSYVLADAFLSLLSIFLGTPLWKHFFPVGKYHIFWFRVFTLETADSSVLAQPLSASQELDNEACLGGRRLPDLAGLWNTDPFWLQIRVCFQSDVFFFFFFECLSCLFPVFQVLQFPQAADIHSKQNPALSM